MTLERSINNDTINTNKSLSVQISLTGLSFLVTSSDNREVLFFSEEKFDNTTTPEETLTVIDSVINGNEGLQYSFDQVTLLYATNLYTLVPAPLFDEKKASEYLKFNSKILANDFISHDVLKNQDLVIVYVPYININNYFFDKFGSFQYYHATSILIKTILNAEKFSEKTKVYLHVQVENFDCIVVKNGKLILCNTFSYRTAEDFIYYLLFCMEQLSLNPESTEVVLSGDIEKESNLFDIVYKYVRHVSFVSDKISFSENTEPHQHFVLKNSL
jgi:hypothetical protein|tara:strand:+ start:95939 stop:96757 length:819 start_codon:yes stop_codon:yes gene_type:complete